MTPTLDPSALAGVRLRPRGVEVRISRASIRSRLFGGEPEPTRLGRFVVVARVGVGGMGVVYAAYDPELDRKVALKVLRNDVVKARRPARQKQLLAEARAMARLSHANVVTVFEVGTVDEEVFVAMEFVDAPTLRGWLVAAERSVPQILRVFVHAGRGVVAAHRAGLVHRDFKPENVLVEEGGVVRVTDFGLAVPIDRRSTVRAEPSSDRQLTLDTGTLTRELAGTPAYMAPEQLGERTVDARADQYSFCVALYEALAGRRPYGDGEVLRMHAEPDFKPEIQPLPERRDLRPDVARAVARGLAFDPADRFENLETLLRTLAPRRRSRRSLVAIAAVGIVTAGVAGVWIGGEKTCRSRHDRLEGIWDDAKRKAGEQAFGATGLAFAPDAWERTRVKLDARAEAWVQTHREACLATRRGEQSDVLLDRRMRCFDLRLGEIAAVSDVLADADADVVENSIRLLAGLEPLDSCADPSDRELAGFGSPSPDVTAAQASVRAAEALRRAGKFDAALARSEEGIAAAERSGYQPTQVEARLAQAQVELAMARGAEAKASFEAVIELGGDTGQQRDVAAAAIGLVEVTGVVGAEHRDGLVLAQAAGIAVASAGNPPRLQASLALARARVLFGAGKLDEGLVQAGEGLEVLATLGDAAQPELADALQIQGTLAYTKGRLDEATEFSTRALRLRKDVFGPAHPAVAQSLSTLAAIALARRDTAAAVKRFEEALELQTNSLGEAHPDTAKTLANLASARRAAGDLAGARDGYAEALVRLEAAVGSDDPRVAAILQNLGGARYDLGEIEPAVAAYERAVAMQRKALGPEHPQLAVAVSNLGRALLERGDAAKAAALLEEALTIRSKSLGAEHRQTRGARITLACAHVALGRFDAARGELDAAAGGDEAQEAERTFWLGRVALAEGKYVGARDVLERALDLRTRGGAPPDEIAAAQLLLAVAKRGAGDRASAAELATAAAKVLVHDRPPSELREFCATDCKAELAELLG